jgi:phenylpropionate dioxygenase-like ring-hydroxylating dioxygenase large terminal subunit
VVEAVASSLCGTFWANGVAAFYSECRVLQGIVYMPGSSTPLQHAQAYWHAAALSSEVTHAPVERNILDERIVLFRRQDGSVAALIDHCPHYGYRLSTGEIIGDDIECAYHGLRFNGTGQCTGMPAQTHIPDRFRVRSYPTVERGGTIFVWMGYSEDADPALLEASVPAIS